MRKIDAKKITEVVEKMCIEANCNLNDDILSALSAAEKAEEGEISKNVLSDLIKNAKIARKREIPICQDTGMAVFFVKIGDEVFIKGNLEDAINEGVRQGYCKGYLRKSVVSDPFERKNTLDNTPAVIYTEFSHGDKLEITFCPKGFGSENKSSLKMLDPAEGREGVVSFVLETVKKAGPNPCPPMVVGVGIGGTMDKAAVLSKKALTRDIDKKNPNPFYAEMEKEILDKINSLGIGPAGFGGKISAFSVNIETFATHIAGLPVAVNISCHATRHKTEII